MPPRSQTVRQNIEDFSLHTSSALLVCLAPYVYEVENMEERSTVEKQCLLCELPQNLRLLCRRSSPMQNGQV